MSAGLPFLAPHHDSDIASQDPKTLALATAAAAGSGVAVYNYHTTLEFIGVLGLTLSVVTKLASYNSPTEFFTEVSVSRTIMCLAFHPGTDVIFASG
eukprot:scaffold445719_cov33-Prasinocladus_malaysianus.AAC.1